MRGALLKVRAALPEERRDFLNRPGDVVKVWDPANGSSDEKSLMQIQEAVVRKRCVILKYDTGGRGDLSKRIVEAPGVVFYARHWHLIARCHQRKAFRDLRLDRMREWEDLKETYSGHEDFSVIDFIQECEDEVKLVPVVIDCENWVLELALAERPVRVEKKREMPGERTRITGKGYSLEWLSNWLIKYGTAMEAREPSELRDKVAAMAEKFFEKYQ